MGSRFPPLPNPSEKVPKKSPISIKLVSTAIQTWYKAGEEIIEQSRIPAALLHPSRGGCTPPSPFVLQIISGGFWISSPAKRRDLPRKTVAITYSGGLNRTSPAFKEALSARKIAHSIDPLGRASTSAVNAEPGARLPHPPGTWSPELAGTSSEGMWAASPANLILVAAGASPLLAIAPRVPGCSRPDKERPLPARKSGCGLSRWKQFSGESSVG